MRRYSIIALVLFISMTAAAYAERAGQNLLLYGNSPAVAGAGGTGVTGSGIPYFGVNPAAAAELDDEQGSRRTHKGTNQPSNHRPPIERFLGHGHSSALISRN